MRIASGVTDQYHCKSCDMSKKITAFGVDRHQARGRKYECKECVNKKRRGRYQNQNRAQHLKNAYGISEDEYRAILSAQGGCCAICLNVDKGNLSVDHDHVTNEIRGLLCKKCNCAIGLLYDDPQRIDRAAKYIRGFSVCALRVV